MKRRERTSAARTKILELAKQYKQNKDSPNDLETSIETRDGSFCMHDIAEQSEILKNTANAWLSRLASNPHSGIIRLMNKSPCKALARAHDRFRLENIDSKAESRPTNHHEKHERITRVNIGKGDESSVTTLPNDFKEVVIKITRDEITISASKR